MKRRFKKVFILTIICILCFTSYAFAYNPVDHNSPDYQRLAPTVLINGEEATKTTDAENNIYYSYSVGKSADSVEFELQSDYSCNIYDVDDDTYITSNIPITGSTIQLMEENNLKSIKVIDGNEMAVYSLNIYREPYTTEECAPTLIIKANGEESQRYEYSHGDYDYIVENGINKVDYTINSDYTIQIGKTQTSPYKFIVQDLTTKGSISLNEGRNDYVIKVIRGNVEKYYGFNIYRKHTDDYYDFKSISVSPQKMTFDRNTTSYTITLPFKESDFNNINPNAVVPIYVDRDEYKRDWISVEGQNGQTIQGGNGISDDYGRVYTFPATELVEGDNIILVRMYISIYGKTIFDKTYTINFHVEFVSENDNSGGSGGGGGGSSTTTDTTTVDTTVSGNTVVVSVSETQLASLFKMLSDSTDNVKLAIINIPKVSGLDKYGIQLPISAFTAANDSGIRLETDIGTLTLMDTMLQNVVNANEAKNVKFNMEYVDKSALSQETQDTIGNHPIISLNMQLDGTTSEWNNPDSPVIVSVPYTPTAEELANPELITVYYIDGQGNLNAIPNATYDATNGCMVFTTTHFSDYAIAYNPKTFSDIFDANVKHAVEVLSAKGIVNGKTTDAFAPKDTVTRAEFITMLSRAFEFNKSFTNSFTDVDSSKYYYKAVGMAKEMNLINGVGNNKFSPNNTLTREQIEIIVDNLIKAKKLTIDATTKTALMSGVDKATRDEVAVLIYNLM